MQLAEFGDVLVSVNIGPGLNFRNYGMFFFAVSWRWFGPRAYLLQWMQQLLSEGTTSGVAYPCKYTLPYLT